MKVEEIEKLLTAFYEGSTTEEQEEILKAYFGTEHIPECLREEQAFFRSFYGGRTSPEVPSELEERLIRIIDAKEEEEARVFHHNKAKRNWRWISSIAASMALLLGVGYGVYNYQDRIEEPKDTFSNPQEAYQVLQATLIEVSMDLNSGINQVSETRNDINKLNKEIKKQIQQR